MRRILTAATVLLFAPACLDDPPPLGETAQEIIYERNASVAAGHQHSCAITAAATVECWGRNTYGQLGNGTTADSALPVAVPGVTAAVAVTAGKYHTCAALADGTARCWGQGDSGQLGNGSTLNRTTPVTVTGLANVTSLSAGGAHTCATIANGQARCWGSNAYGQLGTSTTTSASTPQTVMYRATPTSSLVALAGAVEVETGTWSTCARISGAVACWGRNHAGQLGDGTTTQRNLPTGTSGISTAIDVAVGDQHACAAFSNGRVRCWGQNLMGQLGDGTQTMRTTPVEMQRRLTPMLIYPVTGATAAAAGQYHTCVRANGQVSCAGRNDEGQLGVEITPYLELYSTWSSPAVMAGELAAGGEHTCVRRTDGGTILCFGDDAYGQVGDFGRCPVIPTIAITDITSPGGRLLDKGAAPNTINYIDGDSLELTLATTGCAQVTRVDFRNVTIDEDDPIEPSDGLQYTVTATDLADGTRRLAVRIDFDNLGDGTSYPVTVELTSPGGNAVSATIQVAEVLEAGPDHNGYLDISREELVNEVLQAMYAKFGDANYWHRGDGSWPDAINFYDFDYAGFQLFMDSGGISFVARVKADLDPTDYGLCDPTIDITGAFRVVLDGSAPATEWVDDPEIDIDWPNGCVVLSGFTLVGLGFAAETLKEGTVTEKIEARVAALAEHCVIPPVSGSCDALIQSISHGPDRVRLTVNRLFESVTFRAPYRSSQFTPPAPGAPLLRGIAMPGDPVLVVAAGLAEACGSESCPSVNHRFGPAGLFNWNWAPRSMVPAPGEPWGAHPPILDPWQCDPVYGCAHITGRQGPWLRQQGMRRTFTSLPMPAFNVGGLVARVFVPGGGESPLYFAGHPACGIPDPVTGSSPVRLVVGRNDHTAGGTAPLDGEYGRDDALVSLVFVGFDLGRNCPENPPMFPDPNPDPPLEP